MNERLEKNWSKEKRREFICEILKGEKSVMQIVTEKGISKSELHRNGFYGLSRYRNLKEELRLWRQG